MAQTAYWVIGPSSGWADPSGSEIKLGQLAGGGAATASGSEPAPGSGSGTITEGTAASGLTTGTAYKVAWVVYDDVALTYSGVQVSSAFTPDAGVSLSGAIGNAVAAGAAGNVSVDLILSGSIGNAVAAGAAGAVSIDVVLAGAIGNAVAAGAAGSVSLTNDIEITGSVGDAAAAGLLAGLSLDIVVTGSVGNAVAAGAAGSLTLGSGSSASAADIWGYTLSNGLTAEQTVVAIHELLSELHLIHGLTLGSPLSVTTAARTAGAVSQAVAEAAGTVTVTRQ